jgi:hypothetical protein
VRSPIPLLLGFGFLVVAALAQWLPVFAGPEQVLSASVRHHVVYYRRGDPATSKRTRPTVWLFGQVLDAGQSPTTIVATGMC